MNRAEMHMAIDPVCGMTVDPNAGKPTYAHNGHTYYFCSEGCRTKFANDPERYLDKQGEPSRCRKARSTPARCIPRSCRRGRAIARSAAWRSSRWACRRASTTTTPS